MYAYLYVQKIKKMQISYCVNMPMFFRRFIIFLIAIIIHPNTNYSWKRRASCSIYSKKIICSKNQSAYRSLRRVILNISSFPTSIHLFPLSAGADPLRHIIAIDRSLNELIVVLTWCSHIITALIWTELT